MKDINDLITIRQFMIDAIARSDLANQPTAGKNLNLFGWLMRPHQGDNVRCKK